MQDNGTATVPAARSASDWFKSVCATYGLGLFTALLAARVLMGLFFTKVTLPVKMDVLAFSASHYFWNAADFSILVPTTVYHYFRVLMFAPFFEEAARVVVFLLILRFASKWQKHELCFIVVVLSGAAFGLLHGQVVAVFIQGAMGMLIGFMFMNMYHRSQYSLMASYAACVSVHFMYNLTVTVLK